MVQLRMDQFLKTIVQLTIVWCNLTGWRTSQIWTFQHQASSLDLSTPDVSTTNFSTPDFTTMNFSIMGLKSLGLKYHLFRRLKDISTPEFSTLDFSSMNFLNPLFKKFMVEKSEVKKFVVESSGDERPGVEAWGWKVQDWDVLQPMPSLRRLLKKLSA